MQRRNATTTTAANLNDATQRDPGSDKFGEPGHRLRDRRSIVAELIDKAQITCDEAAVLLGEAEFVPDDEEAPAVTDWSDKEPLAVNVHALPDLSFCPCRKENGGSGVCNCVLGALTIT